MKASMRPWAWCQGGRWRSSGWHCGQSPGAVISLRSRSGAYGWWAGNKGKQGFGLHSPEEMSPELHPTPLGQSFRRVHGSALGVPYGAVAAGFPLRHFRSGKLFSQIE